MIRKALIEDLDKLNEIYEKAREYMEETGNPDQWGKTYPESSVIEEDIADGILYTDEEVNFAFVLMGKEEAYDTIYNGSWLNASPYLTLHRVASNGRVKRVFEKIFVFACEKMKEAGLSDIRIDTHEKNITMQRAVERVGFKKCGLIHIREGERIAYHFTLVS